jgi:hypothetical protein
MLSSIRKQLFEKKRKNLYICNYLIVTSTNAFGKNQKNRKHMTLTDKLKAVKVGLIGNRIDLLGKLLMLGGAYCGIDGAIDGSIIEMGTAVAALTTGFEFSRQTEFGSMTKYIYERTKKHIQEFGKIDERFASCILSGDCEEKLYGYCELQGMYLAAKECGQLATFTKQKKNYSGVAIPNF